MHGATQWTRRSIWHSGWMLLALSALCALPARAAERVDLRSGFQIICDHQRTIAGAERLYLTHSEDSYVDVQPKEILHEEILPPPQMAPAQPKPASTSVQAPAPSSASISAPSPTPNAAPIPTQRRAPLDVPALLTQAASLHHIDVDLLASVVRAESNGNARAVSRAGAQGLMQLMPQTAATLGVQDSFAPAQNVAAGTAYLDLLLNRYHDNVALALAAYNAGPEAVDKYHGIPPYPETRLYVARVIHDFNRRKRQLAHVQPQAQTSAQAQMPASGAHASH